MDSIGEGKMEFVESNVAVACGVAHTAGYFETVHD